jgi:hypothetical protein
MAIIIENKRRWPSSAIAYEIDTKPFTEEQLSNIRLGIDLVSLSTNITLVPRSRELDFLFFTPGRACETHVGYNRVPLTREYKHTVTCDNPTRDSIAHEICHALGLWHEQSRQDRDDHVSIKIDHVIEEQKHNFNKHTGDGIDFGIYDYNSRMHYGPRAKVIHWVINKQVPGQSSKAPPALAAFNNRLHMVHLGSSSNDIWHSQLDGDIWTPNKKIPNQKSKASPALAVFNNRLHMVHLDSSSNDMWHSQFDGNKWTPNEKIPNQKSKASPALAVFNNRLHMVHLDSSSNDIWHSQLDGNKWTPNEKIPNQKSKASPALAVINNRLHMVHLDSSSNDMWHSQFDGDKWDDNVKDSNQKSRAAPTLTLFGSRLYLIHLDSSSTDIWFSWLDDTLTTIVPPPGITIRGGLPQGGLSPGDIAAIDFLYN